MDGGSGWSGPIGRPFASTRPQVSRRAESTTSHPKRRCAAGTPFRQSPTGRRYAMMKGARNAERAPGRDHDAPVLTMESELLRAAAPAEGHGHAPPPKGEDRL